MIDRERLFASIEIDEGIEYGDKSPLEDYVVTRLPNDLLDVKAGNLSYQELADKHTRIVSEAANVITSIESGQEAAVAQLDLIFLMGSYLPNGNFKHCPSAILDLARQQSELHGFAPYMDYELVIDVNSLEFERTGKMRTFLNGEKGFAERDFYYGHHLSEQHIRNVAMELHAVTQNPVIEKEDVGAAMARAASSMREFKLHMMKYAKLSKDAFGEMRPYLASYPDGTRNASGAFMPSVQLAELMLHAPSREHQIYISESMPYFPSWSRDILEQWTERSLRGDNILSLVNEGVLTLDNDIKDTLNNLLEDFYRFRTAHLGITKKQIPEAFENRTVPAGRRQFAEFGEPDILSTEGEIGTGGFDVVNILGGSTYRLAKLQDDMQEAAAQMKVNGQEEPNGN